LRNLIFLLSVFIFVFCSACEAMTGPISIHGFHRGKNYQTYLNDNGYEYIGNGIGDGLYRSRDGKIYVSTFRNEGQISYIDVVGSGYATNKGIEVGMTIQDLTNAYGNIYPSEGFWEKHRNEEDAGMMSNVKDNPQYSRSYSHYYFVSFGHWIATPTYWLGGDGNEEWISFIINKYTGRIEMIHYDASCYRRIDPILFADKYGLL